MCCGSGAPDGDASALPGATGMAMPPDVERTLLTLLRGGSGAAISCGASFDLAHCLQQPGAHVYLQSSSHRAGYDKQTAFAHGIAPLQV